MVSKIGDGARGWSAVLGLVLVSCSPLSSTTLPNSVEPPGSIPVEQLPAGTVAGSVRLDVASSDSLPAEISVQGVTFVQLPIASIPGRASYMAPFESFATPLTDVKTSPVAGVRADDISVVSLHTSRSGSQLIYENNPTTVTTEDVVLVLALTSLAEFQRTPENIAAQAAAIFPLSSFSPQNLNPVPTAENTNFISRSLSTLQPDTLDAVAVLASTSLASFQRTPEALAAQANAIFPQGNILPSEVISVPPALSIVSSNTVTLSQPLPPNTFAGQTRIDIQDPAFGTSVTSFTIEGSNGTATFEVQPAGGDVTPYLSNFASAFINLGGVNEFTVPGIDSTCVELIDLQFENGTQTELLIAQSTTCP